MLARRFSTGRWTETFGRSSNSRCERAGANAQSACDPGDLRGGLACMKNDKLCVSDFISYLVPRWARGFQPNWPADVFAISAALLHKSGAYSDVVMGNWPPTGGQRAWVGRIKALGDDWRERAAKDKRAPDEIQEWWAVVKQAARVPLEELVSRPKICRALIQLCAAADEASWDLGLPSKRLDPFEYEGLRLLDPDREGGSTLCRRIDPSRCRVLPKMHTPQNGLTLRSLSNNLALCYSGDLEPRWTVLPNSLKLTRRVNLLVIPWPFDIKPRQFHPARLRRELRRNLGTGFGFFDFEPASAAELKKCVGDLVDAANDTVGPVHGVILPELAVTEADYQSVREEALRRATFLISGVHKPAAAEFFGNNQVRFDIKLRDSSTKDPWVVEVRPQDKHHRWLLDEGQILQYGLGGCLDPTVRWWEKIQVGSRQLNFVALGDWLSVCVLICEDLARQDPVADVVRSVGPNLVIALLMDGPQLKERWPARYATVLADDPGSSVLSLTSLGMVQLSRPPGKEPSRVVALWKDALNPSAVQIELPRDHQGIVLSLSVKYVEEFSADGRSDGGNAGYPVLSGIHPVAWSTGSP